MTSVQAEESTRSHMSEVEIQLKLQTATMLHTQLITPHASRAWQSDKFALLSFVSRKFLMQNNPQEMFKNVK